LRLACLLPDFGDVTGGAWGDRVRLFVGRMCKWDDMSGGGGLDGLNGLMGGVMIFLMISLVINPLRAAAVAARTGGGALLNTLILLLGQVIDRRLQQA
jgi:hypothetical protein